MGAGAMAYVYQDSIREAYLAANPAAKALSDQTLAMAATMSDKSSIAKRSLSSGYFAVSDENGTDLYSLGSGKSVIPTPGWG